MDAFSALLARDFKIALRSGGTWLLGLVFFASFLTLAAIALGGKFETLRPLAAPMIWMALIFAALLSFEQLFQTDADDGSLEHIKLAETPLSLYVLAKAIIHWVLTILPLLLALPLAALLFDLGGAQTAGLFFAVLIASPAVICYGAFSGACLVGYKGGGMIIVLLTIPLLIPVLIFGVSSAIGYADTGLAAPAFQVLGGLSLIAAAIGIPAAGAALNSVME